MIVADVLGLISRMRKGVGLVFFIHQPRPEEAALLGGRLEGWQQARSRRGPSFETPCCARLLRMRSVGGTVDVMARF